MTRNSDCANFANLLERGAGLCDLRPISDGMAEVKPTGPSAESHQAKTEPEVVWRKIAIVLTTLRANPRPARTGVIGVIACGC